MNLRKLYEVSRDASGEICVLFDPKTRLRYERKTLPDDKSYQFELRATQEAQQRAGERFLGIGTPLAFAQTSTRTLYYGRGECTLLEFVRARALNEIYLFDRERELAFVIG